MLASSPKTIQLLEIPDEMRQEMAALASRCRPEFLYKAMDLCNMADLNYRQASNKQFLIELLLIKLCQADSPSQGNDDDEEGQLKPIVATAAQTITPIAPQPSPETHSETIETAPSSPVEISPAAPIVSAAPVAAHAASPLQGPPRIKLRAPELSLRSRPAEAAVTEEPAGHTTPARRETPYTDADVTGHWQGYMTAHSAARLLINVMRNCMPARVSDNLYQVSVENEIQLNLVNDSLNDIELYIRRKLDNDNFTLKGAIKDGPSSPKTWTESEVLNHMKRTNPNFSTFVDDFKLTLL